MSIAPNKSALKSRLDRYFWSNKSIEMGRFHEAFATHFDSFEKVAVIGGLARDFAREGRAGFRSDVDIVIDAPAAEVTRVAESLIATPNRFGGYGCKVGVWKIDFWALETTWGRQHVSVQKVEDVINCTFFDWDAVVYSLREKKLICDDGYLDRINQGVMDINLRPNPSPMGNLIRAIRRLMLWKVRPGPKLIKFIEEEMSEENLILLQKKERELFSNPVSTRWETSDEALKHLLYDPPDTSDQQLELGLTERL